VAALICRYTPELEMMISCFNPRTYMQRGYSYAYDSNKSDANINVVSMTHVLINQRNKNKQIFLSTAARETQANFLLQVLNFTPSINIPALAQVLNLSTAATSMRITCLKKKAADNRCDTQDFEFLAKILCQCSKGTDFKSLAGAVGMKDSAVRMRLTRLRRRFGGAEPAKPRGARKKTDGGRTTNGKVDFKMEDVKHEIDTDSEGHLVFDEDAMIKELDEL
jgi:hypothetical protein